MLAVKISSLGRDERGYSTSDFSADVSALGQTGGRVFPGNTCIRSRSEHIFETSVQQLSALKRGASRAGNLQLMSLDQMQSPPPSQIEMRSSGSA